MKRNPGQCPRPSAPRMMWFSRQAPSYLQQPYHSILRRPVVCNYTVVILWSMDDLRFEWDERKNKANQRKHGVSFEEAQTVFLDEGARLIPDPDHSEDEERFVL